MGGNPGMGGLGGEGGQGGAPVPDAGLQCEGDTRACAGACVDPQSDPGHCGDCGNACAADALCNEGRCEAAPMECPPEGCPQGSYCDLATNRCVVGCLEDGECPIGRICEDRSCVVGCREDGACPGEQICVEQLCVAGCRNDLACSEAQSCADPVCVACPANRGNCARGPNDGCETSLLDDQANCGACGNACSPERACRGGRCECGGGRIECDGVCIDPQLDEANCGDCGIVCGALANGATECIGGDCEARCDLGFHLCGGACAPDDAVATCGDRCAPCEAPANGAATCEDEACGFDCDEGYVPCEGGCCQHCAATGCEGLTWCSEETGRCEPGCAFHRQCAAIQFCVIGEHECAATVDNSCPQGYRYIGQCSNGRSRCIHAQLPNGTERVFEQPCPEGTHERGSLFCSGTTRVCVPNDPE